VDSRIQTHANEMSADFAINSQLCLKQTQKVLSLTGQKPRHR